MELKGSIPHYRYRMYQHTTEALAKVVNLSERGGPEQPFYAEIACGERASTVKYRSHKQKSIRVRHSSNLNRQLRLSTRTDTKVSSETADQDTHRRPEAVLGSVSAPTKGR